MSDVAIFEPSELSAFDNRADRINDLYRQSLSHAKAATFYAIATGLELKKAQAELGGAFRGFIERHCDFGKTTAYKYIALTDHVLAERGAGLIYKSDHEMIATIKEAAAETDSKSLTELYAEMGIVKRTPSNMGGKRAGAGRPRKLSDEEIAKQAEMIATDPELARKEADAILTQLESWGLGGHDGFGCLHDCDLELVESRLANLHRRAKALIDERAANARANRAL